MNISSPTMPDWASYTTKPAIADDVERKHVSEERPTEKMSDVSFAPLAAEEMGMSTSAMSPQLTPSTQR